MQIEVDEVNRERKKKRRLAEDDGGEADVEADMVLHPPAAVGVCNNVQDQMTEFKVTTTFNKLPHINADTGSKRFISYQLKRAIIVKLAAFCPVLYQL